MQENWVRIPANIAGEADRRELAGILSSYGLEVRIVRVKITNRGVPHKFIEYRLKEEQEKSTQ